MSAEPARSVESEESEVDALLEAYTRACVDVVTEVAAHGNATQLVKHRAILRNDLRARLLRRSPGSRGACDKCTIWAMYANAAAKALEPLGEQYAFDDPDSLAGAIERLVKQAGWKKLAMEAMRFLDADQIAVATSRAGAEAYVCKSGGST